MEENGQDKQPQSQSPDVARSIGALLAERLGSSGSIVKQQAIQALVDKELLKRKDGVLAILAKIEEKERELKKAAKSGTIMFTPDNTALPPVFTKEQMEAIKKLREELGRLNQALHQAFEKNDFSKVFELSQKG